MATMSFHAPPAAPLVVRERTLAGKLRKIAQQLEDHDNLPPNAVLAAIVSLRMIADDLPEDTPAPHHVIRDGKISDLTLDSAATPPNPWVPADPDGLPPETYPSWRKQEQGRAPRAAT